jgi:hypothetical protein
MNTKLLIPAVGVLLLSSSVAALADEHFGGHREGPQAFHGSNDRDGFRHEGFHGDGFGQDGFHGARPYWREHGRPIYVPAQRWCPPPPRAYWEPRPYYPSHWGQGPAYDRDGVTIIFSSHLN